MSYIDFTKTALAEAVARGVRQCVLIALRPPLQEAFSTSPNPSMRLFAVDDGVVFNSSAAFVPTRFADETLAAALEKSDFDRLKASLFVWLGGAGYRALESVISSLAFIASLLKGSGVVFDYAARHLSTGPPTGTAVDALASRVSLPGINFKHIIQPQAVAAMLHGLGFRQVVDLAEQEVPVSDGHLVSAVVSTAPDSLRPRIDVLRQRGFKQIVENDSLAFSRCSIASVPVPPVRSGRR